MEEKRKSAKKEEEKVSVAIGVSEYISGEDREFQDIFKRADAKMYENKKKMKEKRT